MASVSLVRRGCLTFFVIKIRITVFYVYGSACACTSLNVDIGQNPRQHVVIEIKPNAYHNYMSQMAGVILTFFG
jgi:hypothetical protein